MAHLPPATSWVDSSHFEPRHDGPLSFPSPPMHARDSSPALDNNGSSSRRSLDIAGPREMIVRAAAALDRSSSYSEHSASRSRSPLGSSPSSPAYSLSPGTPPHVLAARRAVAIASGQNSISHSGWSPVSKARSLMSPWDSKSQSSSASNQSAQFSPEHPVQSSSSRLSSVSRAVPVRRIAEKLWKAQGRGAASTSEKHGGNAPSTRRGQTKGRRDDDLYPSEAPQSAASVPARVDAAHGRPTVRAAATTAAAAAAASTRASAPRVLQSAPNNRMDSTVRAAASINTRRAVASPPPHANEGTWNHHNSPVGHCSNASRPARNGGSPLKHAHSESLLGSEASCSSFTPPFEGQKECSDDGRMQRSFTSPLERGRVDQGSARCRRVTFNEQVLVHRIPIYP